jgi:hypothetical protein
VKFDRESRERLYAELVAHNGADRQIIKAAEEFNEISQVLLKILFGEDTRDHLAEEAWDALSLLEQMIWLFDITPDVQRWAAFKLQRTARDIGVDP